MAKSQETYSKKERTKRKLQKRREKEQQREERRLAGPSSSSFEDMLAYVDENGNLTTTPPDPTKKKPVIKAEEIDVSVPKLEEVVEDPDATYEGRISYFNHEKGFGFIEGSPLNERVFLHINDLSGAVEEGDKVSFKVINTPRGRQAENVKKI